MPDTVSATLPEVVQRLIDEGPISISAAAVLCGTFRQGKPTHASTLTRWALKGYRLPDGRVVKLDAFRVSGQLRTSKAALVRFIATQNTPADVPADQPAPPTPHQRNRAAEAASAQLDAMLGASAT